MGLLRLLVRAMFGGPRPRTRVERIVILPPLQFDPLPRAAIRKLQVPLRPTTGCIVGRGYVVDGDTVVIRGTTIRLAGIDAPELSHPYGQAAKWALVGLCKGQDIRADLIGEFSHDRPVATCYLPDGRDLSAEMVRLGHAVDWRKFSGGRYRHLEPQGVRDRLWRCDARQKGRLPPQRRA